MTHLMIAGGTYTCCCSRSSSYSIMARTGIDFHTSKPSHFGMAFLLPLTWGREGDVMDDTVMTPEMTPQGDSLPPADITVVSEEDAAKAVEGLED